MSCTVFTADGMRQVFENVPYLSMLRHWESARRGNELMRIGGITLAPEHITAIRKNGQ